MPGPAYSGKPRNPKFHERAKKARAAQTTIDYHIGKLVESANGLSAEQAEQLRALLPSGDTA